MTTSMSAKTIKDMLTISSSHNSGKATSIRDTLWSTAKRASSSNPNHSATEASSTTDRAEGQLEELVLPQDLRDAQPSVYKSSSLKHSGGDAKNLFSLSTSSLTQKLYGRDEQVTSLQKQLQQAREQTRQIALISGCAGTGKSVLPIRAIKPKADFYLAGKFDMQEMAGEPYSAIRGACRILCEDLFCHNDSPVWDSFTFAAFQQALQQQLDEYTLQVLSAIVPGIEQMRPAQVLQERNEEDAYGKESRQSLQNAFQKFLGVLAEFGSVVLVVDDIQWADQASLELLKTLAQDDASPSLLLVATYRTENEDFLASFLKDLRDSSSGCKMTLAEYPLQNLTDAQVNDLLGDVLSLEQDSQSLANCITEKTHGNPFFMQQFLLQLQQDEFLTFQLGSLTWKYDVEEIRVASSATDNVVHLLTQKIQKLPPLLHHEILPRLAFLGTRFTREVADLVLELCCTPADIEEAIQSYATASSCKPELDIVYIFLREGLLKEATSRSTLQWVHDKVQEAASSLAPGADRPALQLELGEWLLKKLRPNQLASCLFVVTNLINAAPEQPNDNNNRMKWAKLNLRAGQAALQASAFGMAANYLQRGIALLPEQKWDPQDFPLSLDMYSLAAQAEFCNGNFESTERFAKEVLDKSGAKLMEKRRAYNVLIQATSAQGKTPEALKLVVSVLKQLGCTFPRYAQDVFTVAGVVKLLASVDKTVKLIDQQTPMTREDKIWGMILLDRLITYAYQCKDKLMGLGILKALRWTVKHGTCDMTGPLIATVAMTVASLGDFAGAKKYADVALKYMTNRSKSRTLFILYALVLHYQTPMELSKRPFMDGYEAGMKSGDIESACWCLICFLEHQYMAANRGLADVLDDCATYNRQIEKHMSGMIAYVSRHMWQFLLNLHDPQASGHLMYGSVVSEEEYTTILNSSKGGPTTYEEHQLNRYRMQAAFWFNQHALAVELMEFDDYHNFGLDRHFPSCYFNAIDYSWCALAYISVAFRQPESKSKHKQRAKKLLKKIKDWVKKGNPNCQTHESLIEADLASLDGDLHLAKKNYEVAVLLAGRWGYLNDHALSFERHADHCLRLGYTEEAAYKYKQAIKLYREWGALAKVELLETEHADLINPVQEIVLTDAGGNVEDDFSKISSPTKLIANDDLDSEDVYDSD